MNTSVCDIAWLAGLLEGEGCFLLTGPNKTSPRISLNMTDKDIVERVAALTGVKSIHIRERRSKNPNHKDQWCLCIGGNRAIGVMQTIYTFMGTRRKAKIRDVIAVWKANPYKRRMGKQVILACSHTDRKPYAHDMCHACYEGVRIKDKLDASNSHTS